MLEFTKPLLNRYERKVFSILGKAVAKYGGKVFPKTRVADVLRVAHTGLSDEEFRFTLPSHFDFVLERNQRVEFAVEFDGPGHFSGQRSLDNDQLKQRIAMRLGLPLLRVDTQYLRHLGSGTVLGWFIDACYGRKLVSPGEQLGTAWKDAVQGKQLYQESHATNSHCSTVNEEGIVLSTPIEMAALVFLKSLEFDSFAYETLDATTSTGFCLAWTFIELDEDTSIIGCGSSYLPSCPVNGVGLARDLAILDARDMFHLFMADCYDGVSSRLASEWKRYCQAHCADVGLARILNMQPLRQDLVEQWLAS